MDIRWEGIWEIKHIRNGKVIWEDIGKNALTQEGEEAVLETFFRGSEPSSSAYIPVQFYARLCNDSLLITDKLTDILGEPSGNGYEPILIEKNSTGFPIKELDQGSYRLVSKVVTFTASGGQIGPVITAYLSTSTDNLGKLIAYRSLAMTRTILDGDSMTIQFRIKVI